MVFFTNFHKTHTQKKAQQSLGFYDFKKNQW